MSHTSAFLLAAFTLAAPAVAGPAAPAADAPQPHRYAVLVGVNHYQHKDLPDLQYSEADAADLAGLLRDAGYDVTLLTNAAGNKDDASKPTKANIEKALHDVLRRCQKGDTVVVALSGHGVQFQDKDDCYYCPQDARPFADETGTLVSLGDVYAELNKSFAGVKVLLVDACRDDPKSKGAAGVDADNAPRPPRGVAVLFSCSKGEKSFESDKYKHGVFIHFVLEGLRSEAADKDGKVTFNSLSAYVQTQVGQAVPKVIGGGAQQSPNLKADLSGEPPVLVTVKTRPNAPTPALPEAFHLDENFGKVPVGKLPAGWTADDNVSVLNDDKVGRRLEAGPGGSHSVELPKQEIKGDFFLEWEYDVAGGGPNTHVKVQLDGPKGQTAAVDICGRPEGNVDVTLLGTTKGVGGIAAGKCKVRLERTDKDYTLSLNGTILHTKRNGPNGDFNHIQFDMSNDQPFKDTVYRIFAVRGGPLP